eukprot:TRINITY_DN8170_c0_g1_i1.p2 TRINITY_DN8170_c0_g1~~TRINITY_DN8170_c0_g1_i1.p2  ORF type:complete len:309 (+),score=73.80 TRINITY_DN8170_c0_g1_i1:149-1075(+)
MADFAHAGTAVAAGAAAAAVLFKCFALHRPELPEGHWLLREGQVVGHRGCRIPEEGCVTGNTMSAFRRATENSMALELDVQMTECGEIVVFHDLRTGKILDGERKRVTRCTYDELLRRTFIRTGDEKERVPTLSDVVALAKAEGLKLVVELKGWLNTRRQTEAVLAILGAEGYLNECMIISFNPAHIYTVRSLSPTLPTAFIASDDAFAHHARKYGLRALLPLAWAADYIYRQAALRPSLLPALLGSTTISAHYPNITSDVVARARRAGLTTNAWTVNCQQEAWRLRALGVNLITTDKPHINFSRAQA